MSGVPVVERKLFTTTKDLLKLGFLSRQKKICDLREKCLT